LVEAASQERWLVVNGRGGGIPRRNLPQRVQPILAEVAEVTQGFGLQGDVAHGGGPGVHRETSVSIRRTSAERQRRFRERRAHELELLRSAVRAL